MNKLIIFCSCLLVFIACKKDDFTTNPDARINLSVDTLKFDTVFTRTGSITQSFKIVNPQSQPILLNKVSLMGGNASAFRININGENGPVAQNVTLAAKDSIYIFVSVFVNPGTGNLPFIISDSIEIDYNSNKKLVQLQAFGQNAIFLRKQTIYGNQTWTAALPYVILDGITIDTNAVLNIQAGTKIYSSANSPFNVDGTLLVNGTKTAPVIFTGNRLDEPYANFPASWPGIYLNESSKNNTITFAEIKNAYQALVAVGPSINSNPKLNLQQSTISNAYSSGIFGIYSDILANNCLVYNSNQNLLIQLGGNYQFTNCTMATYSTNYLLHKTPVAIVTNFAEQGGQNYTQDLQAYFTNCIFWSDENFLPNELVTAKQGSNIFNVVFKNCIYKAETDPAFATISQSLKNTNPQFDSINVSNKIFDFRITKNNLAPGINTGISTVFAKDLDNNNRMVGNTDIGCYEKQ